MDPSEDIFSSHLPPDIILNILSRVPIKTVFTCKCVCKSWLELLESPEFARSHLSNNNSVPGWLMIDCFFTNNPDETVFTFFEFQDSPDKVGPHELRHYKVALELFVGNTSGDIYDIEGSADGLLLLWNATDQYVCNPITREYIELPEPDGTRHGRDTVHAHGFGATVKSEQYKVVRISHARVRCRHTGSMLRSPEPVCEVYTLGTGSWRSISTPSEMSLDYVRKSNGKLLNGKLHWLARDSTGAWWISRFDLEAKSFTRFRAPPVVGPEEENRMEIGVLRDRLCFCDYSSETEICLYVMNDLCGCGRESWDVECVISKRIPDFAGERYGVVYPVKAYADGDLLMVSRGQYVPYFSIYSNRTKTIAPVDFMLNVDNSVPLDAVLYTPTFVSLKGYDAEEDVKVLESVRITSGL